MIGPLRREASTLVRAWLLTEGDQALGGETILVLHRDALRRTITVVWDTGQRVRIDGDRWILLACRGQAAGVDGIPPGHCGGLPAADLPMTPRGRFTARRTLDERADPFGTADSSRRSGPLPGRPTR
ncbi:MAG TPA: hypothetical protein VMU51_23005 [Mycobacteriales bacterium]|nr:hypothetical protein [Mycobacteriales bacterium]